MPLRALSQETGAQLVVQSAEGIEDLRLLARLLRENLSREARVQVEDVERVRARGGEAYGLSFAVADEARGRVAGGRARPRHPLVIARWAPGAPPHGVGRRGPTNALLAPGPRP